MLKNKLVFLFLSSIFFFGYGKKNHTFKLAPHEIKNEILNLDSFMPETFVLGDVTFTSDNRVSENELKSLFSYSLGDSISRDDLKKYLSYLSYKQRFKSVDISLSHNIDGSINIEFNLSGGWVLRAVKIHGIALGKAEYRRYYNGECGSFFSFESHKRSLKNLEDSLKKKGHFLVQVLSYLTYNHKDKSVDVHIVLEKGAQFVVDSVSIDIVGQDGEAKNYSDVVDQLKNRYFKMIVNKKYNEELIGKHTKEAHEFLTRSGFSECSIKLKESRDEETKKISLLFSIEVGKKKPFLFFGNHFFTDDELQDKVIKFGDAAGIVPLSLIAQDLIAQYHRKGFWSVVIETREAEAENYFVIKEGERASIKDIVLKGVSYESSDTIIKKFFNRFQLGCAFDELILNRGIEALVDWYQSQGFADVQLLKKIYEPLGDDKENQKVTIVIHEGKQLFFGRIVIDQHEHLLKEPIFRRLVSGCNKVPFSYEKLSEQRSWLHDYFKKLGYRSVRITFDTDIQEQDMNISWKILLGDQLCFGKTIVKGITTLSYERIMKSLAYEEGDVWSPEKLRQSRERMRQFGLFKQISLSPAPASDDGNKRSVIVSVQEDDPFEVRLRIGFAQVSKNFALKKGSTYKIGGSALWRNVSGRADQIVIDTDFTRFEQKVNVAYAIPRVFNSPVKMVMKVYDTHYTQPIIVGSRQPLYEAIQQGFVLSLTATGSVISSGLNCGLEWMETKNVKQEFADAIAFKTDLIDKKIPYLFIEPNLLVDLLDDKINPTKGSLSVVSVKGMFPFKESSYLIKVMGEHSMFGNIMKKVIFGFRVRFGHIFKETFNKIMPPERFYLGGPHSMRGYQTDGCPPLGNFLNEKGEVQWVPQGGKTMLNINCETRIPLFSPQIQGVIFQDFGYLIKDKIIDDKSQSSFLASSGCGLRYLTPIGPLRFDIGWKWFKSYPQEPRHAWVLTFGHAF